MVRFSFLHAILFVILSAGINGQYDNCTGELDAINDGRCDYLNNNVTCGYDGGDCCECSCTNDRRYPCGIWDFDCLDPDVVSSADSCHQETLSSSRLCASDTSQTWLVDDTTSAASLVEAVNCSGGTFTVTWRGRVLIDKVIYISNGTTLYVTGEGSGAEINGGGETRLFTVVDAFLYIEGLILTGGNATYGGAIAATRSGVYLNQTLARGNIASSFGGVINIGSYSTLAWEGQTNFTGNHAGRGGGAVAIGLNSTASWSGTTIFSSNSAGGAASWSGTTTFSSNSAGNGDGMGGAIYVNLYSRIVWNGVVSFVDNKGEDDGGAIFAGQHSFVSWDGVTSFVDNTATVNGGALRAAYTSIVSWNGNTSFVNNTATLSGGALYVYSDSNVSWDGVTSFVDNTATMNGGALCAWYISTVAWNGDTSFVNNNATLSGGALYIIFGSKGSWNGITSFIGNSAAIHGGAVYASEESSVLWTEETSFTGNNAISSGGAIYVTTSSSISVGGETNFLNNEAALDGGAVFFYAGNDEADSSYFNMVTDPVVFFQENTCGGNGGAIALIGNVITRSIVNVTFMGNTAGLAGGATYISDVNFGMRIKGAKFISNSALIGGGLYSTGSGNDITNGVLEDLEYNPTTLIGCLFIRNKATKTGGAMDSRAGRDDIVNTSFVGNTAPVGGALKVDGTTSLTGCEFVENISGEDAGPGVFNGGIISRLSNCSFVYNALNCKPEFFLGNDETDALFETACRGCDTEGKGSICNSGCIVEGKEPICNAELKHSSSAGGSTTLESLMIESGYWRATNTSMHILACYNSEACLGGLTGTQDYCREGYKGPYCSVCSKGYTPSLGFTCNKCFDHAAGGITFAVVVFCMFLFVFGAFLSYLLSPEKGAVDQGILGRVIHFLPLQSLKIVIVVWQILTQFASVANVVFPSVYQQFLDAVNVINFELSWMVSAKCIFNIDFHDQLLLSTLGPLVCMAILGATYVAAMRRSRDSEEARQIVRRKHVSMVLLVTFLVYSSVSSTLFKTFACDHLDDGKTYLRADYRIECDSSKHKALGVYAGFMVFLYVVGIPAFYGFLLYTNRKALIKITGREDDESVKFTADLWKPFRPERFYYEVIECARRVLLTGALVFIYPNSAAQIAAGLMMTTFFIFVSEALAPYESRWDTWCSRTGHAIVFMSIFLALLLKVDLSEERASSQKVFELVLIVAHSCLILIVVVEAAAMVVAWKKEVKEDTEPRIRPSLRFSSPNVERRKIVLEDDAPPPSYEHVVSNM